MGNSSSNDAKDLTKEIYKEASIRWNKMNDAEKATFAGQPVVTLGQDGHLKFTKPTTVTQKPTTVTQKETDEMAALKKAVADLKIEMAALKKERELRELRAAEEIEGCRRN